MPCIITCFLWLIKWGGGRAWEWWGNVLIPRLCHMRTVSLAWILLIPHAATRVTQATLVQNSSVAHSKDVQWELRIRKGARVGLGRVWILQVSSFGVGVGV